MARICLDPGHDGMIDPGAVGPAGTTEAEVTMSVCQLLQTLLEQAGHEVILTRSGPDAGVYELYPRVAIANYNAADLFVSVHCNSFSNPLAHGAETWYTEGSVAGKTLAQAIQDNLIAYLGLANRGVKSTAQERLYVLLNTAMPAVLVEIAFISNPEEEALLASGAWQQQAANAIAAGISQYLGV